jgi:hypothetical protein
MRGCHMGFPWIHDLVNTREATPDESDTTTCTTQGLKGPQLATKMDRIRTDIADTDRDSFSFSD